MESEQQKKSFWRTKKGVLLLLFIWPYVLLYYVFKWIYKSTWTPLVKFGAMAGVILFLIIVGASSSQSNNASVLSSQTKISPVQKTELTHSVVTAAPTITPKPTAIPTATPRPTSIPVPTRYIAPTATYIAPTTPPAANQSSGLTNDNYYTNVNGTQVHSPADSTDGSIPAGATAKCNDGTYSFSQHHSGTCSGHEGVAQWL